MPLSISAQRQMFKLGECNSKKTRYELKMAVQQLHLVQPKDNVPALFLERDLLALSIEERFLASAQRILDKESIKGAGDKSFRHHQIPAFLNFGDYLMDIATSPKEEPISPFCRHRKYVTAIPWNSKWSE
ncbi:MAG: hypothetical protein AB1Z29_13380 [Desulfobacterales bacterium]